MPSPDDVLAGTEIRSRCFVLRSTDLIVVNCILLGRAEAFAAKNNPLSSFFDGLGMGLGFTIALTLLGGVREFLGTGKLFNIAIMPEEYGMLIFVLAPGAFIVLGYLIAIVNRLKKA